jgi:hypothetical protein
MKKKAVISGARASSGGNPKRHHQASWSVAHLADRKPRPQARFRFTTVGPSSVHCGAVARHTRLAMPAGACLAFFLTPRLLPPPCPTPTTPTPTSQDRSTIATARSARGSPQAERGGNQNDLPPAPDPEIHFERLAITLEQTPRVGSADTANQSQRYALKGTSVC